MYRVVLIVVTILTACSLSGCGTLRTVVKSNGEIGYDLRRNKTNCSSIPRVYSGTTYNFCRLHAEPKGNYYNYFTGTWLILDMCLFSPFTDTVVLPVTIYQQATRGNAKVNKNR